MFFRKRKKEQIIERLPYTDFFDLICWVEIPVKDIKRALKFYKEVFDCDFDFKLFNNVGFAFFKSNNTKVKGTLIQTDKTVNFSGPLLFLKVTGKMTSILNKVPENGGKIIKPKEMVKNATSETTSDITPNFIDGNIGYYAKIEDTEGNQFALYSNS